MSSSVPFIIALPRAETFDTAEDYHAVAFHELTHSTGHESHLNRAGIAGSRLAAFGSADYSREELVAEMGSAFLCAEAGIESTLDNSAAYLKGWLVALGFVEIIKTIRRDRIPLRSAHSWPSVCWPHYRHS